MAIVFHVGKSASCRGRPVEPSAAEQKPSHAGSSHNHTDSIPFPTPHVARPLSRAAGAESLEADALGQPWTRAELPNWGTQPQASGVSGVGGLGGAGRGQIIRAPDNLGRAGDPVRRLNGPSQGDTSEVGTARPESEDQLLSLSAREIIALAAAIASTEAARVERERINPPVPPNIQPPPREPLPSRPVDEERVLQCTSSAGGGAGNGRGRDRREYDHGSYDQGRSTFRGTRLRISNILPSEGHAEDPIRDPLRDALTAQRIRLAIEALAELAAASGQRLESFMSGLSREEGGTVWRSALKVADLQLGARAQVIRSLKFT